jgi:hypothetical protein
MRPVVPHGGEEFLWKNAGVDIEHVDLVVSPPFEERIPPESAGR